MRRSRRLKAPPRAVEHHPGDQPMQLQLGVRERWALDLAEGGVHSLSLRSVIINERSPERASVCWLREGWVAFAAVPLAGRGRCPLRGTQNRENESPGREQLLSPGSSDALMLMACFCPAWNCFLCNPSSTKGSRMPSAVSSPSPRPNA